MQALDSFILSIGMETSGVSKGLQNIEKQINVALEKVSENASARLSGNIAKMTGSLLVGTLQVVGNIADKYLQGAAAAGKFSAALGENSEQMQAWAYAVESSGGSTDTFYKSLAQVAEKVDEFAATGAGAELFKSLGIEATDSNGKVRASTDLLADLARQAETMDKRQFTRLASKLGLDPDTIAMIGTGSKNVGDLISRQKDLGTYSKDDSAGAAGVTMALNDLSRSSQLAGGKLLALLAPAFTKVAGKLAEFFGLLQRHAPFVGIIAGAIAALFVPALLSLAATAGTAAAAAASALLPLLPLAAAIGVVAYVIDDLFSFMDGKESSFSDFWSMFGSPEELKNNFKELKAHVGALFDKLCEMGPVLAPVGALLLFIFSPVTAAILGIAAAAFLIMANWGILKKWFAGFCDWISEKLEWVKNGAQAIGRFFGMGDATVTARPAAADAMNSTAVNAANSKNINANTNVQVGAVNIQTQATDAQGIAKGVGGSLSGYLGSLGDMVTATDSGVNV